MRQYKILLAIILLSCSISANAQLALYKSVIANGAGSYASAGLSANWTVGQTVINQYTSSGLTITEGFHPVEAPAHTTGVAIVPDNITSVKAYPNPTSNILNIAIVQDQPKAITIQVSDVTGKVVKDVITLPAQRSITTQVDMSSLSPGTYTFIVNAQTKDAYTMKVVKQ
jgi:hypothetical protein